LCCLQNAAPPAEWGVLIEHPRRTSRSALALFMKIKKIAQEI
jgi:hypothetical protein